MRATRTVCRRLRTAPPSRSAEGRQAGESVRPPVRMTMRRICAGCGAAYPSLSTSRSGQQQRMPSTRARENMHQLIQCTGAPRYQRIDAQGSGSVWRSSRFLPAWRVRLWLLFLGLGEDLFAWTLGGFDLFAHYGSLSRILRGRNFARLPPDQMTNTKTITIIPGR